MAVRACEAVGGRLLAVRGFVRADVCLGVALWRLSVSAVICPVVSVSGVVLSWVEILGACLSTRQRSGGSYFLPVEQPSEK